MAVLLVPKVDVKHMILDPLGGTCLLLVIGTLDVCYEVVVGSFLSDIPIASTFLVCLLSRLDIPKSFIL